jgi:hypothetical protein
MFQVLQRQSTIQIVGGFDLTLLSMLLKVGFDYVFLQLAYNQCVGMFQVLMCIV